MKKVLLVDDDEVHLAIIGNMLKDQYEITAFKSGKETLDYLLKEPPPDVILLDIQMPAMDGWEVFNNIKGISTLKRVPIAFMTGLEGGELEKQAYLIGANDYIRKPCEKDDLVRRIEAMTE